MVFAWSNEGLPYVPMLSSSRYSRKRWSLLGTFPERCSTHFCLPSTWGIVCTLLGKYTHIIPFQEGISMPKILVIDDQPDVRTLTDMLLKHLGYDVVLADNGWRGLELYRQEHPDVIVLDLIMPGMDGIEVLKQIRSVDLTQPVIVVTGNSNPETEGEVRALGVSEFILKGSSSMQSLGDILTRLLKALAPVI